MGKLIVGSFMFVGGLFFLATGVGALIGIPMFIGGLGMGAAGIASLGKTAVKTGVATGRIVRDMRNSGAGNDTTFDTAPITGGGRSVADEITKLADLVKAGHLTQDEFDRKKAQLLA